MPVAPRRIVLAPIGSRGDVQPMLALALGLRDRGHTVTFAAPANFAEWVRSHGIAFAPVGGDIEADLRRHGDRLHGTRHQIHVLRQELVPDQFAQLPEVCDGADLIVGAGLQIAGPSVAQRLGIPYAFVAYAPVALRSAHHPPPIIRRQSLPRVVNRLGWWAFNRVLSLVLAQPVNQGRRALGLSPIGDVGAHLTQSPLILAADQALTGPVPDLGPQVRQVPALRLDDPSAVPPAVSEFLDRGPPPALVGFGSMVTDRAAELTAQFARAAEAAEVRLLIQSGWAGLTDRHGALPPHCLLAGHLPHDLVLPRVAGVVHHGGAGTTASAARAGRPQLLLPYLLDQFYWAGRVRALGLGPAGPPIGRVRDVHRLATLLRDLVRTSRYGERAAAVAARMTGDGVLQTVRILERV